MVVLGFDQPMWAEVIGQQGPEIAAAVMAEVSTVGELVLDADVAENRVVAVGAAHHRDRYTAAWNVTEALTELFIGFGEGAAGLRLVIGGLQVDVPAVYFTEAIFTRRRWATLSRSMLVHSSVHGDPPSALFDDQHSSRH